MRKKKMIIAILIIMFIGIVTRIGMYWHNSYQKIKEEERINKSFQNQRLYIENYFGIVDTDYKILYCDNQIEKNVDENGKIIAESDNVEFNAIIRVNCSNTDSIVDELKKRGYSFGQGEVCSMENDNNNKNSKEDSSLEKLTIYSISVHDYSEWMKNEELRHSNIHYAQGFACYKEPLDEFIEIEVSYIEWFN